MARVRVHQHVNPLAKFYRELPVKPLDAAAVYEDPFLPFQIDIGCGRGRYLLSIAKDFPEKNFLGIEIREPLVEEANEIRGKHRLKNLHYIFCNAPLDFGKLLSEILKEQVELVTIQFPDPWFKKRHAKRRMVNENLVKLIDENLSEKGRVFVQTDVEETASEIREHFEHGGFKGKVVNESILPIKTEREISVEDRGLGVYRIVFTR